MIIHTSSVFRIAAVSIAFLSSISSYAEEEGFKPMFNGRDLSGWVNVNCAPETWSTKDGIVYCTGFPTGALRTERQYENFIIEAEWRHMKVGGNAGVFIWGSPIAEKGVPFLRGIEVQVLDHGYGNTENYTTHGDVFPIHGATMKPFGPHRGMRSFPTERRSKPSPEWNHYRVICQDGVVRLHVNGKEVSGGEDCMWRKGYLALESEGAPVEWRNVRIKELPSSGAKPEQTAPESKGHKALYNGIDLRGWKAPAGDRWKPSDWRLLRKAGEPGEPLWTESEFGDCELIVDCRLAAKGPVAIAAILLGGPGKDSTRIALEELQPGKWSRFEISVRAGTLALKRDGVEIPGAGALKVRAGARAIGLETADGELEFANLFVRPL